MICPSSRFRLVVLASALVLLSAAGADAVELRMATVAPQGTAWARAIQAFSHEVESLTAGRVRAKWYWGGLAGDEIQVLDRIARNQLDGQVASLACLKLAPSLRAMRVAGIYASPQETDYVLGRLRGTLADEFRQSGFAGFAVNIGEAIVFSRQPVRTLAELKKLRTWTWTLDATLNAQLRLMGLNLAERPIEAAGGAYERGELDGFIAIPSAVLAFQWGPLARYYTDLKIGTIPSCITIANRVFDALPVEDQHAIQEASARLGSRGQDLGRQLDAQLVQSLFVKQGLHAVPADEHLAAGFAAAARAAAHELPPDLLSPELLHKIEGWLVEYRHGGGPTAR
jgi:TRAP-type C4-dicarboxylate transport system substrate-binding protein